MKNATFWTILFLLSMSGNVEASSDFFEEKVAPIFEQNCLRCHQGSQAKGGLDLSTGKGLREGGNNGRVVFAEQPQESRLLAYVSGDDPKMPKTGDPLTDEQLDVLRKWIAGGADWPKGMVLEENRRDWWSLERLDRPELPKLSEEDEQWVRTPVDAFIVSKLREKGLSPNPEADRRTLIRRLYFDLVGLPPTPEEVESFVQNENPKAYENLVERLLDSPHYGERWARHWLDVAHYADTHGFDKDKLRRNAWPYRDYVIRAFNDDKPYSRFVKEQLAGDVFYPNTRDGIVGLGFIASGPFDYVGQIEVDRGTMEKKRVRNLDRDDMVATTMNAFVSMTAQCARCHDHKFDPITQEDYYSLQAVFAAVDRADRPYEPNAEVAKKRQALQERQKRLAKRKQELEAKIGKLAGGKLEAIDRQLATLSKQKAGEKQPEYGYHSRIEPSSDVAKWVQVDLGQPTPIAHIVYVGCHDTYAGIGAGFGFPVRYKIEVSNDPEFQNEVTTVVDRTLADVTNPGVTPQSVALEGEEARYVRMTATKLAERKNDYIFALAELSVLTPEGVNAASGGQVTSLDSIQAPPRWQRKNLVDGYYYGVGEKDHTAEIARLESEREALLSEILDDSLRKERVQIEEGLKETKERLEALPPQGMVYAAATEFSSQGNFQPTHGEPRPIYVLNRGSVKSPDYEVGPGTVGALPHLDSRFDLSPGHEEGRRRAALARWIVDERNPLTWRSIVNRVWHYHFGRGIVNTPNDFGRMGAEPTHPDLLDWLAVEFRDEGQSIKDLHRLIVCSSTYRQSSEHDDDYAKIDSSNQYLWRMNRQRLEAEAIRDAVLAVSGQLSREMYGPGFKAFGFKNDHSPHYKYHEHDPDDPASHRRSIYRFIVRSVPDPFMETLDCADPSTSVAKRNETLTALQALALLNNKFMVRMAEHFASRVETMEDELPEQVETAWRLALGREPTAMERKTLVEIAREHGLANACRLIFNTNEFIFVD